MVEQYVDLLRFFRSGSMVILNNKALVALLNKLDDDEVAEVSDSLGVDHIRDDLLKRGLKVNHDNVLWYISKILGHYYGWFRCDFTRLDSGDNLHLSHSYGYKWSIFILHYIDNILLKMLARARKILYPKNLIGALFPPSIILSLILNRYRTQ
jgi:hypothetical protein